MTNTKKINMKRFLALTIICLSVVTFTSQASAATENPAKTFYTQFIVDGGQIVWFVLLPMSIITFYLILDLSFSIRRKKLLPAAAGNEIASLAQKFGTLQLPARIVARKDLVSKTVVRTIAKSHNLKADHSQLQQLAAESLHEFSTALFRKVEWCAIIGNVAPMVGLFGTVFGMIQAFNLLGISGGQPPADQLAARISVALITTFWGLLVAIPALAMHGVFRTRAEAIVSEAAIEVETLLHRLKINQPIPARILKEKDPAPKPNTAKVVPFLPNQKNTLNKKQLRVTE